MKKGITTVLAGMLAMSLLGACGNSSSDNSANGGSSSGKVKIEFFQNKAEAKTSFDKLVAKFNEANPNIVVTQVNPPDAETVLKTRAAKKNIPDVVGIGATDTFKSLATGGLFEDLSSDPVVKNIQPAYADMLKNYTANNQLNGVPFAANANGVIYNKAMFAEVGAEVPKTWDEFIAVAEKFKAAGKNAFYITLKDSWTTLPAFNALSSSIVGIDFYGQRQAGSAKFAGTINEVAQKQLQLTEYAQKDIFGKTYNDGNVAFAKGEAAMYLQGVWAIPEIQKANPSIDLGVFVLPATNDPSKNKLVTGVDTLLAVSKTSKHPAEAKKFIEFMLQPESVTQYITEQKAFPTITGVTQDDKAVEGLKEAFTQGNLVDFSDHYIPAAMKIDTLLQEFLQKKDVDAFTSKLDTEWDKVANRK
ncbi:ABC transporter substrate-binding protein [Paenibacillus durus]|uniref:ABC transporter substrate-binding protein n=1 Tax=Paenibacillus durus TaxID=44251 RepID=A0A089HI59_PAEDU|nr:extracellular solute-binding protein [Paenibacillus durus]AIQ11656.1 ABC transporter substrate-binding protein [Paenibacillus durus]